MISAMAPSFLDRLHVPHVFTLLTGVILFCCVLTWIIPSGEYDRETMEVGALTRNVIVPNSYEEIPKNYAVGNVLMPSSVDGQATPVGAQGFLSAIPRGMEAAADVIFFIFVRVVLKVSSGA